jgi:hypothetical protein
MALFLLFAGSGLAGLCPKACDAGAAARGLRGPTGGPERCPCCDQEQKSGQDGPCGLLAECGAGPAALAMGPADRVAGFSPSVETSALGGYHAFSRPLPTLLPETNHPRSNPENRYIYLANLNLIL